MESLLIALIPSFAMLLLGAVVRWSEKRQHRCVVNQLIDEHIERTSLLHDPSVGRALTILKRDLSRRMW